MSSDINPNLIDITYPVAGQDNSTQGFRDNWSGIKENFEYAASEINDLQSKAVLKSALSGATLDNDLGNSLVYDARVQQISLAVAQLTSANLITVNFNSGHYQFTSLTSNSSIELSNWPASGQYGEVNLEVDVSNIAYGLTLPSTVDVSDGGITGLSGNVINFPDVGTYVFNFNSRLGSTANNTISISENNTVLKPFNNSSEDLADGGDVDLAVTASYFSTGAAETANLAAGVEGQIKTFLASNIATGNMTISVTNAAWGGSGEMFFDTTGQGCILQYINGNWYCIGNNGCTFS